MQQHHGAREEWKQFWFLPLIGMFGFCLSLTHLYSMGVAIGPIEKELGWSRTVITGGLTVVGVVTFFLAPVVGMLVDRYGPRWIALTGVVLYSLAYASVSLTGNSLVMWWLSWSMVAVSIVLIKPMVWTSAIVSRFDKSRGLALSITFCGSGIGASIIPLVMGHLIEDYGWRLAYAALGLGWLVVFTPITFFFFRVGSNRSLHAAHGHGSGGARRALQLRAALRSLIFLRLATCAVLFGTCMAALLVHMVPILQEVGLGAKLAAGLAGFLGVGAITGRLSVGLLLDRVRPAGIIVCTMSAPMIAIAMLVGLTPMPLLAGAACFMLGLAFGSELDLLSYLASRYFGTVAFGTVFGALVGLLAFTTGFGPLLASMAFDMGGSYRPLLMVFFPIFLLCMLLLSGLGPYPEDPNTTWSRGDDGAGNQLSGLQQG